MILATHHIVTVNGLVAFHRKDQCILALLIGSSPLFSALMCETGLEGRTVTERKRKGRGERM